MPGEFGPNFSYSSVQVWLRYDMKPCNSLIRRLRRDVDLWAMYPITLSVWRESAWLLLLLLVVVVVGAWSLSLCLARLTAGGAMQ